MPLPEIRALVPADVDAATEMVLGHGWGVRREWLAFAATHDACVPVVAVDEDGGVAGTGVGTANGSAGWIGSIFVAPDRRGLGLGRALTQAIIDRLESTGCRTLVLVATAEGRRLYERMAFEVQTRYQILEAQGLDSGAGADAAAGDLTGAGNLAGAASAVRTFEDRDLGAMAALDLAATGEDRAHALRRLSSASTARVLSGPDGAVRGFVVRPPWGGGATIAVDRAAAMSIVNARRLASGADGKVRVGILAENEAGRAALHAAGFTDSWSAPRMIRGAAMDWHPDRIWGQFNHAMG